MLCLTALLWACGPDEDLESIMADSDSSQDQDSNSDENPDENSDNNSDEDPGDGNSGEDPGDGNSGDGEVGTAANNTYYVTPEGLGSNDGFSPENSLSIVEGFRKVKQGDILYIKMGNYSFSQTLSIGESGTLDEPIYVVGYRNTPGDIDSEEFAGFSYGQGIQDANFPTLVGNGQNGVDLRGNYIYIRNLAFANFASNVDIIGDYNKVSNCVFFDTAEGVRKYDSFATRIYGEYNEVYNCYAENIEFAGFLVAEGGRFNHIHHSQVVCDELRPPGGGTDYYFMTEDYGSGTTSNNLFEYNLAQRLGSVEHPGRGLDNKGGHDNVWRYNVIENTGIEMEFSTSYNNQFYGNIVRETRPDHNYNWCHFELQSGPHDNYIYGNYIDSGNHTTINIVHADDGATSNSAIEYRITENNWFFSNIFINGSSLVRVSDYNGPGQAEVRGIHLLNNTIVNMSSGINVYDGVPTQIELSNNIFSNCSGQFFNSNNLMLSGTNNNFHNSSYSASVLTSSFTLDPLFVGGSDTDYNSFKIRSDSPLINIGTAVNVEYDFERSNRTKGSNPDLGAFEIN